MSVLSIALLSSYKMAYRIMKCKKPHTTAEKLILPTAVDIINTDESSRKLLSKVPFIHNTIK